MVHRSRSLLLIGLCQPYYSAMSTLLVVVNAGVGLPREDWETGGLWYSFLLFPSRLSRHGSTKQHAANPHIDQTQPSRLSDDRSRVSSLRASDTNVRSLWNLVSRGPIDSCYCNDNLLPVIIFPLYRQFYPSSKLPGCNYG